MTKEEKNKIEYLTQVKTANSLDKALCEEMVLKFVDNKFNACKTCDQTVRLMFTKLKNWWANQNPDNYKRIKSLDEYNKK